MSDVCDITSISEQVVREVREALPEEDTVQKLAESFRALSDPTRLKILLALVGRELCVCNLATALGMSQSAISHHLRTLRSLRLVRFRREGRMVYYSLADEHILELLNVGVEHAREP
ncbi:MAG: helix-turn-helix transcriptional regulator [Euryarchaeota archaeon]|nr:helix-turn-helix transcriptional regulator [Euryarchaeota archaeon]